MFSACATQLGVGSCGLPDSPAIPHLLSTGYHCSSAPSIRRLPRAARVAPGWLMYTAPTCGAFGSL
eukprot:10849158-Alexandrium_andersonii.AAC.1